MSRSRVKAAVLIGLFFILCAGQSYGQGLDAGSLARLFVQAEEQTGVPSGLLASIAIQESSFNPWALNMAGQGYYESSWRSALARVRKSNVRSYDLGLMQINSSWLRRFDLKPHQVLNPSLNVTLGSLILKDCLARHGLTGGLSCYNTGEPDSQTGRRYAGKVLRNWKLLQNRNARF